MTSRGHRNGTPPRWHSVRRWVPGAGKRRSAARTPCRGALPQGREEFGQQSLHRAIWAKYLMAKIHPSALLKKKTQSKKKPKKNLDVKSLVIQQLNQLKKKSMKKGCWLYLNTERMAAKHYTTTDTGHKQREHRPLWKRDNLRGWAGKENGRERGTRRAESNPSGYNVTTFFNLKKKVNCRPDFWASFDP